jgi:hypothetical protein
MAHTPGDELLAVEDQGWPILVARFPPFITAETMRSFARTIESAYEREERFAAIIDTTLVTKFPSPGARQLLTDWVANARRAERERLYTVTTVVVIPSGPLRAFTAAINFARRPTSPQHWVATIDEAARHARKSLLAAGIALPAAAEAMYAQLTASRDQVGA